MFEFGKRLKAYREARNLSQQDVREKTGITDSRLSRYENGCSCCPAKELGQLADVYGIDKISLFIEAGYLCADDLRNYQQVFQGVGLLNEEECTSVQKIINLLNKSKEDSQ